MARSRSVPAAGIIATAALVLLFGNQPFTEWVSKHTNPDGAWGWFMRVLTWPRWAFGPDDDSTGAMRRLIADDLRALLLILFVALILGVVGKAVTGGGPAFFVGWSSLVFGSALAAFLTAFILQSPTIVGAFQVAAAGSAYGLFAGWIVGAAAATGKGGGGS